jgi:hypothetical protein
MMPAGSGNGASPDAAEMMIVLFRRDAEVGMYVSERMAGRRRGCRFAAGSGSGGAP